MGDRLWVPYGVGGQLQVGIHPDIVFRVGGVGTLLVNHQKHLVTGVGCTTERQLSQRRVREGEGFSIRSCDAAFQSAKKP